MTIVELHIHDTAVHTHASVKRYPATGCCAVGAPVSSLTTLCSLASECMSEQPSENERASVRASEDDCERGWEATKQAKESNSPPVALALGSSLSGRRKLGASGCPCGLAVSGQASSPHCASGQAAGEASSISQHGSLR